MVEETQPLHRSQRPSLKMAAAAVQQPPNLPDEIWLSIFNRIDFDHHLESLSLVNHHFLTLTNNRKRTLHILPSYPFPSQTLILIRRFTNLRSIDASRVSNDDVLHSLLQLISLSECPLQELNISNQSRLPVDALVRLGETKRIKVLKCSRILSLRDDDLMKVAEAMPWIRDLDISYPENDLSAVGGVRRRIGRADLSDVGIEEMSHMLPELMRINLSGNHFISDRAIVALATNCGMLREIEAVNCSFLTQIGIAEVIRKSPNLASVAVRGIDWGYSDGVMIRSSCASLYGLHFSYLLVSDGFLSSLVEAKLPLKQLTISSCFGFSFVGIYGLVSAYQNLTYLNFERMLCLTDETAAGLTALLPRLVSINLNYCTKVGRLTFLAIVKLCCCIEHISMGHTGLGKGWVPMGDVSVVNRSIRSLKMAGNLLPDKCAVRIASACPNLEVVDLSQCIMITATGIAGVLNSCREIRHLFLNQLSIDGIMNQWDTYKIEVLEMKVFMGMKDDQLDMLGSKCPNLLSLDLSGSEHLSVDSLKRLVMNCTKLRQIKLDWFEEMSFDNLASIVLQRRSLRKVVFGNEIGSNLRLTAKQKDVLLKHGCRILDKREGLARSFSPRISDKAINNI